MAKLRPEATSGWKAFFAWVVAGLLWALSILGAFTVGLFILPLAILLTWLLVRNTPRVSRLGLFAGVGLMGLWIGFGGAVECFLDRTADYCSDSNPLLVPILIGVVLVGAGIWSFAAASRRSRS